MINAQQEAALQTANDRSSRKKQDKTNPMVIHIENARLMPNTPRLRVHKDYRVYTGNPTDDIETRKRWLKGVGQRTPRVVDSTADVAPFDVGTATADDLVMFAFENYGKVLDSALPPKKLREAVKALADAEASASLT
jgi:hypothetical protein